MTSKLTRALVLITVCSIGACVTINVYFPAAAAEKAADRIIREVWDVPQRPAQRPPQTSSGEEQSRPAFTNDAVSRVVSLGISQVGSRAHGFGREHGFTQALSRLFLVTPAYAQADLTISTPAINKLTASMKARHAQLAPYYTSGAVGPPATALVSIRDAKLLALKDRNRVKKLVSDENTDRNALYREIAKANKHPEWEASIRSTFARRWIANAQSGWWYQKTDQAWQQK